MSSFQIVKFPDICSISFTFFDAPSHSLSLPLSLLLTDIYPNEKLSKTNQYFKLDSFVQCIVALPLAVEL